ncbi:unnamed protein product [Didymodactylos carnosus]|uniref:MYND-type domain-containing protein n=1 Tax=Didymodactylos carnosus TaxID=1234261 RepID=A0A8S2DN70_9BILA|nr:unnamed protein product [Didymodactylos carnosus]CAF3740951.1 unnamed protein product [Didymodactylos carnosus]
MVTTRDQSTEVLVGDIIRNSTDMKEIARIDLLSDADNVDTDATVKKRINAKTPVNDPIVDYKYNGDVYQNKKHGKGTLTWADGRTFTGHFYGDKRHGFGSFEIPTHSAFKGLYRDDERFGPGIVSYTNSQNEEVGYWLENDLARLCTNSSLTLDITITVQYSKTIKVRSWFSHEEILDHHSKTLFVDSIDKYTKYFEQHRVFIDQALQDRHDSLNTYLNSMKNVKRQDVEYEDECLTDDRYVEMPNLTPEIRDLYYYTNKFWPLRQYSDVAMEQIATNNRDQFLPGGPLEQASLNLIEYAYRGMLKEVRDIVNRKQAFVDVSDDHGYTALHMSSYQIHIPVINFLLDSGANVNQMTDSCLTPLMFCFIQYYANDTMQNIALEHRDPTVLRPAPEQTHTSLNSHREQIVQYESAPVKQTSDFDSQLPPSYGYEITSELRNKIKDETFRQSIYDTIMLLLRRGADPTLSDWPFPVLCFAIRAGDLDMVNLLLKKKADVNCKISDRFARLSALHIACGCMSEKALDISKVLIQSGAYATAETKCGTEYLTMADPILIDMHSAKVAASSGRTPLHIACSRTDSLSVEIVRLLLNSNANPNAVCNGQSPLTLAIANGNEPVVDLLLKHPNTDPSIALGWGNGNALCSILSTLYEQKWPFQKRIQLIERLIEKNPQILYPVTFGPKRTIGSVVDYAYHMFFTDHRIAHTPYHSLNNPERLVYNDRKELLAFIAKRFREEAVTHENLLRLSTPVSILSVDRTPSIVMFIQPESSLQSQADVASEFKYELIDVYITLTKFFDLYYRGTELRYCANCGRSTGVRLTNCNRCNKVAFCSKPCKVTGWNTFHKKECKRSPTTTVDTTSTKKSINVNEKLFKDSVLAMKTPALKLPPLSVSKLLRMKRKGLKSLQRQPTVILSDINLSWNPTYQAPENYSFN